MAASTGCSIQEAGSRQRHNYPWLADDCDDILAIGTPGPSKVDSATGPFARLWEAACNAIRAATEVILVGYRFPETDAHARDMLVSALRESGVSTVRVVLGLQSPDAPRVRYMVDMACGSPAAIVDEMWAQDFLGLWRP